MAINLNLVEAHSEQVPVAVPTLVIKQICVLPLGTSVASALVN